MQPRIESFRILKYVTSLKWIFKKKPEGLEVQGFERKHRNFFAKLIEDQ